MPLQGFNPELWLFHSTHHSRFELDPADTEYRWENVREALTEPGEYYFDRLERALYYLPELGEDLATADAVVPGLGCFLRCEGRPEQGHLVEWVNFDGLTFVHGGAGRPAVDANYLCPEEALATERNFPVHLDWQQRSGSGGKPLAGSPQAAVQLPGVVLFRGSRHCSLTNCAVAHGGWYGVEVGSGCAGITLERNELHDLGGGGVRIGGADAATAAKRPDLLTTRTVVTDNHIHHCGQINLSAVGVAILHAAGNLVEHNHIHDLHYSGVSCGWSWGYGESVCRENRIGWNRIHDLGKGVLSDMGGIYLLGVQPGTRVYNNLVFNVKCRYYGGWGVYADEGSAHVVVEENICHDCSCEGFHQHYGRENIVRHNVFAFPGEFGVAVSAGTGKQRGYEFPGKNYSVNVVFIGNVVLVEGKPFLKNGYDAGALAAGEFYSEGNCFWDVSGAKGAFAVGPAEWRASWQEWRDSGHDRLSWFMDPGFVDAAGRDFRLRPDSPLLQGPFRALDPAAAGIRRRP